MNLEQLCLEQEEIIEKQAAQIRGLLYELVQFRALEKEERRQYFDAGKSKGGENAESY